MTVKTLHIIWLPRTITVELSSSLTGWLDSVLMSNSKGTTPGSGYFQCCWLSYWGPTVLKCRLIWSKTKYSVDRTPNTELHVVGPNTHVIIHVGQCDRTFDQPNSKHLPSNDNNSVAIWYSVHRIVVQPYIESEHSPHYSTSHSISQVLNGNATI